MDLQDIEYSMDRVTFIHGDVATVPLPFETFDLIIACSSIEHIGIEGRYGSTKLVDGDLAVMRRLAHSLAPQGRLVLTVPVGRDAVFKPVHRVYGETRLPMLLRGYSVLCEEYWAKEVDNRWHCCSAVRALQVQGSPQFYALGCFVLFPSRSES
jgi:SAM-dependent methyltransferase